MKLFRRNKPQSEPEYERPKREVSVTFNQNVTIKATSPYTGNTRFIVLDSPTEVKNVAHDLLMVLDDWKEKEKQ